jgi:hypothetical protein
VSIRYPWPTFASPLQCRLTDVRLDGELLRPHLIDDEHLRVRLEHAGDWERFDCEVSLSTDEPLPAGIDRVLPYVLVSSTSTNTRMPFPLTSRNGDVTTGRLNVPRSAVAGSFTVHAETGADLAGRRRVVGSSDLWTIVLDHREAPIPPGAPPFEISWIDFTSAEAPLAARENSSAHVLMDLTSEPRLILNSGIEGLQALLYNNNAKLERRRVRDVLNASIARYATTTLFRAAAAEVIAYDDDAPQPPTSSILRQTCEAVAEQMPGIGGVEELYEELAKATDNRIADTELWMRIDLAIDSLTGSADALSAAAKAAANG